VLAYLIEASALLGQAAIVAVTVGVGSVIVLVIRRLMR
jgi:hypothetical protein